MHSQTSDYGIVQYEMSELGSLQSTEDRNRPAARGIS